LSGLSFEKKETKHGCLVNSVQVCKQKHVLTDPAFRKLITEINEVVYREKGMRRRGGELLKTIFGRKNAEKARVRARIQNSRAARIEQTKEKKKALVYWYRD